MCIALLVALNSLYVPKIIYLFFIDALKSVRSKKWRLASFNLAHPVCHRLKSRYISQHIGITSGRLRCDNYTVSQKMCHFYFYDNFGNIGPIFIIIHC